LLYIFKLLINLLTLVIVQYGLPPDRRIIGQADQGPSVRQTRDHRSSGPSFMKTTNKMHDPSVGRPHQNLDQ